MQEVSKALDQMKRDSKTALSKESHAKEIAKLDETIGTKMRQVEELSNKVQQKVRNPEWLCLYS